MILFLLLGLFSLLFGMLFLFSPKKMTDLSNSFSRAILNIDQKVLKMHIGIGICLIALGIVALFLYYYFLKIL